MALKQTCGYLFRTFICFNSANDSLINFQRPNRNSQMPILKKFCFCLSLRTGGIILGLFHLICTLLGIVTFAMTAKLAMMLGSYRRDTMALDAEPAPIEDSDYEEVWGLVGFLSVCLNLIIASSLLITGAVKVSGRRVCSSNSKGYGLEKDFELTLYGNIFQIYSAEGST